MDESTSKQCRTCAQVKAISDFGKRREAPDGRRLDCNECRNARRRLLYGMSEDERARDAVQLAERRAAWPSEKTCAKCGLTKDAAEFGTSGRRLRSRCFECSRADGRAHHAKNRERRNAQSKRWRAENPDLYRAICRRYEEENAALRAQKRKEKYEADPEVSREKSRENSRRFRARRPDYYKTWYQENRERAAQTHRDYLERWPGLAEERNARRRATVRGATVSATDLAELWTGLCNICGAPIDDTLQWPDPLSKSLDHIHPIALGGEHTQENLAWVHLVCNKRKGAKENFHT